MEDRGVGAGLRACPPNGQLNHCPPSSIRDFLSSILNPRSSTQILMMRLMLMPAAMFGVAKDQRFDHHRNRLGIGPLLTDIDEIKVFQIDAVDGNDSGAGDQLALDDVAHEFGDVRVE